MSPHYHSYITLENSKNKIIGLNGSITQPIILSHPVQKFSNLSQFHAILQYLYTPTILNFRGAAMPHHDLKSKIGEYPAIIIYFRPEMQH